MKKHNAIRIVLIVLIITLYSSAFAAQYIAHNIFELGVSATIPDDWYWADRGINDDNDLCKHYSLASEEFVEKYLPQDRYFIACSKDFKHTLFITRNDSDSPDYSVLSDDDIRSNSTDLLQIGDRSGYSVASESIVQYAVPFFRIEVKNDTSVTAFYETVVDGYKYRIQYTVSQLDYMMKDDAVIEKIIQSLPFKNDETIITPAPTTQVSQTEEQLATEVSFTEVPQSETEQTDDSEKSNSSTIVNWIGALIVILVTSLIVRSIIVEGRKQGGEEGRKMIGPNHPFAGLKGRYMRGDKDLLSDIFQYKHNNVLSIIAKIACIGALITFLILNIKMAPDVFMSSVFWYAFSALIALWAFYLFRKRIFTGGSRCSLIMSIIISMLIILVTVGIRCIYESKHELADKHIPSKGMITVKLDTDAGISNTSGNVYVNNPYVRLRIDGERYEKGDEFKVEAGKEYTITVSAGGSINNYTNGSTNISTEQDMVLTFDDDHFVDGKMVIKKTIPIRVLSKSKSGKFEGDASIRNIAATISFKRICSFWDIVLDDTSFHTSLSLLSCNVAPKGYYNFFGIKMYKSSLWLMIFGALDIWIFSEPFRKHDKFVTDKSRRAHIWYISIGVILFVGNAIMIIRENI